MPIYKKCNKDFFKKWNSEMAYVLGFFAADGNMVRTNRNTHFTSFYSADKSLIESIQKAMNAEHAISKRISETGCVYRMQIGSKEIFADLLRLGFVPGKTNRLALPKVPSAFFSDFVRGYFDGDGNIWVGEINKSREKPTKVLQVAFTSASKKFLIDLKACLYTSGIKGGTIYSPQKKNFSRLSFSTLDSLKLGELMYNDDPKLFLKRKKLRFVQFKQMRV